MLRFVLDNLKPFKIWIFFQLCVVLSWAFIFNIKYYLIKDILDTISFHKDIDILYHHFSVYLLLTLLIVIVFRLNDWAWLNLNPPLKKQVCIYLMDKMMRHSHTFFQNQFSGGLSNRIKDAMSALPDLIRLIIIRFIGNALFVGVAIYNVSTVQKEFGISLFVWVVFFIAGSTIFSKKARALSMEAATKKTVLVGHLVDILSNILSVRLFSKINAEKSVLRHHLDRAVSADQKRDWYFMFVFAFQGISFLFYEFFIFYFLFQGYKTGTITAGDFGILFAVNSSVIDILWGVSEDIGRASNLLGEIDQGIKAAFQTVDVQDKENAKEIDIKKGEIFANNITFQYKKTVPLFENLSFSIQSGGKIGLVGYSGSGKTTLINLLLRLYDVHSGSIYIDNQDIKSVKQESLHRNIGLIPQDPMLFHRSIFDNIAYGIDDATMNNVIESSKKAHAHDFISLLPDGYHSFVGERGVKLSGGQRQRIAIARIILKNPPILILDEATSALDSLTETYIQESLWRLMEGKTAIVIAHRLSTLMQMDKLFVFDKGRIVEQGKHEDLLLKGGLYTEFWNNQIKKYV